MKCVNCNNDLRMESTCMHCENESAARLSLSPRIKHDLRTIHFPEKAVMTDLQLLLGPVTERKGLYLTGIVGSGKTMYAAQLLMTSFTFKAAYKPRLFISVPELLQRLRESFDSKTKMTSEVIDAYSKAELLVMDDLGVEKTTDWVFQTLYLVINRRYENFLPTIFTSNLTLNELAVQLGDEKIPSRINIMCDVRIFDEKSFR